MTRWMQPLDCFVDWNVHERDGMEPELRQTKLQVIEKGDPFGDVVHAMKRLSIAPTHLRNTRPARKTKLLPMNQEEKMPRPQKQ